MEGAAGWLFLGVIVFDYATAERMLVDNGWQWESANVGQWFCSDVFRHPDQGTRFLYSPLKHTTPKENHVLMNWNANTLMLAKVPGIADLMAVMNLTT